ncbi:MAG: YceD family protein [Gemmatimonadota bacterium]
MLKVDLGELARKKRLQIDASLPVDAAIAAGAGFRLVRPLAVQLEVQLATHDVVVLGRLEGEAEVACRRCLVPVRAPIDQEVTLLFREGVAPVDAEAEEIYPLPARGNELDLSAALREHLLLAVPEFLECQDACKGLCPNCGVNLNETTCSCERTQADDRWSALRQLSQKD